MTVNANAVRSWLSSELPQLLLIILLVLAARSTLADHYFVPSGSMEYTLLPGDRVFVNKAAYGIRIPFTDLDIVDRDPVGRGEIVIFDSPRDGTRLIKRIVAVAGDHVVLHDGRLRINGETLHAGFAGDGPVAEAFGERSALLNLQDGGGPDIAPTVIPDGMVLAVGDHRGRSLDGRIFGMVPESVIYGRAVAVYYRRNDGFVWLDL